MTVTELAILHSTSGGISEELEEVLVKALPIQDEWVAKTCPESPANVPGQRGAIFHQVEDPSKILLLGKWESVAEHYLWIASDPNQQVMGNLASLIATGGEDRADLFHLDVDIFGALAPAGSPHILDSPVISVGRMYVESSSKAAFQNALDTNIHILRDFAQPHQVQGGWRVDNEEEAKEEYVMLVGWESVDRHAAFAQSTGFNKYAEIRQYVTQANIKHYKRLL